ncbi:hypothetical protein GGU45_000689 [Niabella hirudinis]
MFSQRYNLTLFYLFEFEQNVRNVHLSRQNQSIQPGDKTKGDFSLYFFYLKVLV